MDASMLLALDWSNNVIFGFLVTGIAYLPLTILMLRLHAKWKARYALIWSMIIALIMAYNMLSCLGSILSLDILGTAGIISLFSSNFLLVLFVDSVNRDKVDSVKVCVISIMWAIASMAFIISSTPVAFQATINENLLFDVISASCAVIILFLPGSLVFYHGIRIFKHVPRNLKPHAGLFLAGGLLIIFTSFLAISDVEVFDGLGLSGFIMVTAITSITTAFLLQPKLAYILPFKAIRLTVIDTGGGIPIFNYTWQPGINQVDETLFSGMLQGVSVIIKESLNQGNVQEMILDEGIMILQRSHVKNIACVLVATKSSHTLRDGLRLFSERFYMQFKDVLVDPINKESFTTADALVTECFPFLLE